MPRCQDISQAGAKITKLVPRYQQQLVPRCQDAKISAKLVPRYQDSFAREAIWSTNSDFPPLPETTKSTILVPE